LHPRHPDALSPINLVATTVLARVGDEDGVDILPAVVVGELVNGGLRAENCDLGGVTDCRGHGLRDGGVGREGERDDGLWDMHCGRLRLRGCWIWWVKK